MRFVGCAHREEEGGVENGENGFPRRVVRKNLLCVGQYQCGRGIVQPM